MKTYHIYLKDRCLFKNLDDEEFEVIWGRIYRLTGMILRTQW